MTAVSQDSGRGRCRHTARSETSDRAAGWAPMVHMRASSYSVQNELHETGTTSSSTRSREGPTGKGQPGRVATVFTPSCDRDRAERDRPDEVLDHDIEPGGYALDQPGDPGIGARVSRDREHTGPARWYAYTR